MPTQTSKRSYNSSRRAVQAAQTRDEVIRAATELFPETGWTGTTLAAIAERAGVSVETIYNGFGSKKGLLRAAMDAAVVGDTEPVPYIERPETLDLARGTLEERIARGGALVLAIHERAAGVWQAIVEAASADDEVAGWRVELELARRLDVARSLAIILGEELDEQVITMLWVIYSPEAYLKLTHDAGFTRDEYERFIVEATHRLVSST